MWRANMSIWIYLLILSTQSITHAERVFYVSDSATSCNLATPDIHFGKDLNTVSLAGANLNIAEGVPVWSGYVQTYAAFLYDGCCEAKLANSSANYTNMNMDPGECYYRCQTDVIGMQTTTCHCNPEPGEKKKNATGCTSLCSSPYGAVCGDNTVLSIYRKVEYPEAGAFGNGQESQNCRALYWKKDNQHFYKWNPCWYSNIYMCDNINATSATEIYFDAYSWSSAARQCLQHGQKPAMELSSGYPDLNASTNRLIWIGQIRSRVIDKYADFKSQLLPGWRRGTITKAGGSYVLQFNTYQTTSKSLCENVSTIATSPSFTTPTTTTAQKTNTSISSLTTTNQQQSTKSSQQKAKLDDTPKFPMNNLATTIEKVVVYVAVPVVLAIIAVVVIVILCKRRQRHAKESVEPPDYVNSVQHAEIPTAITTDVDLTQYETCSRTDSSEHQYSALEYRGDNEHCISTNVDNAYENQIHSAANVYINT